MLAILYLDFLEWLYGMTISINLQEFQINDENITTG